ncbi:MAG: hypothetical protein OXI37_08660, partial [Gammaproteobacteria bacterium]|nr:hypothetical protein [Gammaproteobacteria bacterium]
YWASQKEKETAIDLLEVALKKLRHENMDLSLIATKDHKKARELTKDIQEEAKALEKEIYDMQKKLRRLVKH